MTGAIFIALLTIQQKDVGPYEPNLKDWFKRAASTSTSISRHQRPKGEVRRAGGKVKGIGPKSRSQSRENIHRQHRGTIATISGGTREVWPTMSRPVEIGEVQVILIGANTTPLGRRQSRLVITFDDRDLKLGTPIQDELMVISVVAAEYKVERVLIDQGSSANILYWSAFQKMGLRSLNESQGTLYGFAGECVPIKITVEIETIFREGETVRVIPVLYTMIDAETSYNIIIGRLTLNKLGAVVSTYHLCMKFLVGRRVGSIWVDSQLARRCYEDSLKIGSSTPTLTVNALNFDLDPRCVYEGERLHPAEDVKNV
ncbi:hypothetical protein CR513_48392, partial [Mucuna pruriens]